MIDTRKYLAESKVDNSIIHKLLRSLSTPFNKWPAYRMGIIDDKGKIIRNLRTLTTYERQSFTQFDILVMNLKKILEQTPTGKTKIATYAASLYLLREEANSRPAELNEDIVYEDFTDFFEEILSHEPSRGKLEQLMEDYLPCPDKSDKIDKDDDLEEDAPANSVASGGVAGISGDPVVRKTFKVKRKKTFKEV